MIIDIHGHYTTAPTPLQAYRGAQIAASNTPRKGIVRMSDDQIRESLENTQLKLQRELTIPEVVQTIILTRGEGHTTMPAGESLAALAAHHASLCIFLSARLSRTIQEQLFTAYTPETPVAILYRVSWPDEKIIVTRLQDLHSEIRKYNLTPTTLILVGEAIGSRQNRSCLYHTTHTHMFRRRGRARQEPSA